MAEAAASSALSRRALFVVFLLSGCTGLIYESLWTHYLKLFLGHAAFAQSLVLVLFMGGMAFGGWLVGMLGPRRRNLLMLYALAEACIGLYALAFHPIFVGLEELAYGRWIPALSSPQAVEVLQWSIAVLLLLPPSILLGATFPLMSGAVIRRHPGRDGGHLAMLYFTNSIGAAGGALLATFVLIGWLGLPGTLTLAGAMNLALALAAAALARVPESPRADAAPSPGTLPTADADAGLRRLFLLAAFATGAASFIYEVVWIRMLSLVLGSSFHAFELMLSAFITGLALGSLLIRRRIDRLADPLAAAAWIQIAMGLLAVATLPIYGQSFEWMAALVKSLPKDDTGWLWFNLASHGIAFAVMLPATVMAGMTLPLFTRVLLRGGHGERSIGLVYACNSVGSITGVLLAVHAGLVWLGLELTLAVGAMADIVIGLLLLRAAGSAAPRAWAAALASLAVPALVVRLVALDPTTLASGVFRSGDAHPVGSRSIFFRDGKTATISVTLRGPTFGVLATNGKADAAIEFDLAERAAPDEVTMVLLAALPLSLHPGAERIANIGFGSGMTTHVALTLQGVKEVSTIEIEPAVVEGSRAFAQRVHRAYRDPRSKIYFEDAKSWFARHRQRFDLVISEPSNPWVSGVASLFSDEYYRRIRDYIAERGLFVQWLQLYEFDLALSASIVKALDRNFDDYAVYDVDHGNVMIVASPKGAVPPLHGKAFAEPAMRGELDRVGVRSIDDLHVRFIGRKGDVGRLMRVVDAPVNSDFHPYVELHAPRSRFMGTQALQLPSVAASELPMVEMLAQPPAPWVAARLGPGRTLRLRKVEAALDVRRALLGEPAVAVAGTASPPAAYQAAQGALGVLRDCAALGRDEGLAALHGLANATLAYLDTAALAPLWEAPQWLPCPPAQWPAAAARQMALYAAVARRDAPAMQRAGTEVLEAASSAPALRAWALKGVLLAQRRQGPAQGAQALWQRHGPSAYPDGNLPPDLMMLLAPD